MLKQRIIPSLLLKDGRMVKGKNFGNFRDVGDPVTAAKVYNAQKVDELMFLDIRPTAQSREQVREIIQAAACECFMPLTVGGAVAAGARMAPAAAKAGVSGARSMASRYSGVTSPVT